MNTIVMGPTQSGKTYFTKKLLHAMSRNTEKQILIFDQQLSYAVPEDGGFDNIEIYDSNIIIPSNIPKLSITKILTKAVNNRNHVLINTASLSTPQIKALFEMWAYKLNRDFQDLIIVFEEAYHSFPRFGASQELQNLLRNSAKKGIDMIFVYQSIVDTDIQTRRQAHYAFLFKGNRDEDNKTLETSFSIPSEIKFADLPGTKQSEEDPDHPPIYPKYSCISISQVHNAYGVVDASIFDENSIDNISKIFNK